MFVKNVGNKAVPVAPSKDTGNSPLIININNEQFKHPENYGCYVGIIYGETISINTASINRDNWRNHFDSIVNLLRDGIESDILQKQGRIQVQFSDNVVVKLTIFDYLFNIIMWYPMLYVGEPIVHKHLFFSKDGSITKKQIKKYMDANFIDKYKDKIYKMYNISTEDANILLNNIIDMCLYEFNIVDEFSMYLCNTINLEDDIRLMKENPEYYAILHSDLSQVPIEQVKDEAMAYTNRAIGIIKKTPWHCLNAPFLAGEGINPKQYREYGINIAAKPDGNGGIFPWVINKSFIRDGVNDIQSTFVESHGGRTAQIIAKCNVGTSGHFARLLGLNNRDTRLSDDPNYDCHSHNFIKVYMKDDKFLEFYNGRYYRLSPDGMEYKLSDSDKSLVGQTLYFRSPITCAGRLHGKGICYKCYGDLAYANSSINIGQLAAELLSSDLTQRLLSAKHLLEASVKALRWTPEFYRYFEMNCNIISLTDNIDFKGYKMIIDTDDISVESEEDDFEYNDYIESFRIKTPLGEVVTICTQDNDPIYISADLMEQLQKHQKADATEVELNMESLIGTGLFLVYINNNELSAALNNIKAILNKTSIVTSHTKDSLTQELVEAVMKGGLGTIAVHLELIISNQIRDKADVLQIPDWSYDDNQEYQLLTLDKALTFNPSVTISIEYQKLSKQLYDPLTFRKHKPSMMDLLCVERPQDYFETKELISDDFVPAKDDGSDAIPLITFINKN